MCELCLGERGSPPAASLLSRRDALRAVAAGTALLLARPLRRSSPAQAPGEGVEVVPGLTILLRSAWAGIDRNPTRNMPAEDVRFLLVHHTASSNDYGPDGVIPVLRGAYDLHVGADRRFADIAYNFLIDRFGRVWEGRMGSIEGPVTADATGGSQGFAQLVCLIGDFTNELPTPEAVDSLTRTLAWLADRHFVDTSPGATVQFVSRGSNKWAAGESVVAATISGHRDMSATACPGDTFYPVVQADLQGIVTAFRGGSAAIVPPTAPTAPATAPTTAVAPAATVSVTSMSAPTSAVAEPTGSTPAVAATSSTIGAPEPNATGSTVPSTLRRAPIAAPGGDGSLASEPKVAQPSDRTAVGLGAGAVGIAAVAVGIAAVRRGRRDASRQTDPESGSTTPGVQAGAGADDHHGDYRRR